MSDLSPQRKKVVVLCAAVACMSGGAVLFKGHPALLAVWICGMIAMLVYAAAQLIELKKEGQ